MQKTATAQYPRAIKKCISNRRLNIYYTNGLSLKINEKSCQLLIRRYNASFFDGVGTGIFGIAVNSKILSAPKLLRIYEKSMNVLVTGANGFIGSNLCKSLIQSGLSVIGLVRESSDMTFLKNLSPLKIVNGKSQTGTWLSSRSVHPRRHQENNSLVSEIHWF